MKEFPSHSQKRILWIAITGICLTVIGALFVGGIWLSGQLLAYLQPVLVPLAVAGILAYILEPVVAFLEKKGMGRTRSISLIYGVSLLLVVLFVWVQIAFHDSSDAQLVDGRSVAEILEKMSPQTIEGESGEEVVAEDWNQSIADWIKEVLPQEMGQFGYIDDLITPGIQYLRANAESIAVKVLAFVNRGANEFFGWFGFALGFIMVPIYLFFFLREAKNIRENWHQILPLRDSRLKTEIVETLLEINRYLAAFFRGQVLVSVIDGVLVGVVLKMFGHPFGLALGALLAFLGVIPIIGNLICWVPALVTGYQHYALEENQFWLGSQVWPYLVMIITIFIVVQNINSMVTQPKIVGDSVGLHPMTVIFSMLFWSLVLGGFLGALLAVPLTAIVKVILERYVWTKQIKPKLEEV